jgi:hypothetical protein
METPGETVYVSDFPVCVTGTNSLGSGSSSSAPSGVPMTMSSCGNVDRSVIGVSVRFNVRRLAVGRYA